MINCVLIQNNIINEIKVKNLTEESIYKKCNFKNNTDFSKIKDWVTEQFTIELWGKTNGFSNSLSNFVFYKNNSINIYGKSIFLMKDNDGKYISLIKEIFIDFFKLSDYDEQTFTIENSKETKETKEIKETKETKEVDDDDNDSEYSYNSELSYELYEYSDEESIN
jgi:hypothetical protein